MTPAQFLGVVQQYEEQMNRFGYPMAQAAVDKVYYPGTGESIMHVRWMLDKMHNMAIGNNFDADKANRWLGFVQGIMWVLGIHSVDEMRAHISMRNPA